MENSQDQSVYSVYLLDWKANVMLLLYEKLFFISITDCNFNFLSLAENIMSLKQCCFFFFSGGKIEGVRCENTVKNDRNVTITVCISLFK